MSWTVIRLEENNRYMKKYIIHALSVFLKYFFLKRQVMILHKQKKITSINFHDPTLEIFQKHIELLKKHNFDFLSLQQVYDFINGHSQPSKASVFITFDDGWKGNLKLVPYIERNNIPVCIFLNTRPVQRKGIFWNKAAMKYPDLLPEPYNHNPSKLYDISNKERIKITDQLEELLPPDYSRDSFSIVEIKELAKNPLISFGVHTHSHTMTTQCEMSELEYEIAENIHFIEEWTSQNICAFAYPNGRHDGREVNILEKHEVKLAFKQNNAFIDDYNNVFLIPRFGCVERSFPESICKATGLWKKFTRLKPSALLNIKQ